MSVVKFVLRLCLLVGLFIDFCIGLFIVFF